MTTTTTTQGLTVMEMLHLNEIMRLEAVELQKLKAAMPMMADPELRQEMQACLQEGQTHLRALTEFAQKRALGTH